MISYWKQTTEIYNDEGLVLITGWYDHKNQTNGGHKALGVHWGGYPKSHGVLSPCVIPEATRNAILSGLLHQAVTSGDLALVDTLKDAIAFLNT